MAPLSYLNFDLHFAPATTGYQVRVLDSPAGQTSGIFVAPFSEEELADFTAQILQPSNRQSTLFARGILQTVGNALFAALFTGELYACLIRSLDAAERQGAGLRIRLRLADAPALTHLPWEFLHHSAAGRFLTLSTTSPLVYYLDLPQPAQPLAVSPPVGILVLTACPTDLPPLDGDKEWSLLEQALGKLVQPGTILLVRLHNPTLLDLQRALRQHVIHIIHFVGHGLFDEVTHAGAVAFCTAAGLAELVSGTALGQLLHNERTLRLVVLNACEGSRTALADPFTGVAQALVQQGLPAVIAMQYPFSEAAALTFAGEFYGALADGYPVDAALTEARVAIATRQRGGEWGAPRLFMRTGDGILWQIADATTSPASAGATAGQTLGVLPGLMGNGEVRTKVAAFRADFRAASQQIDLLVQYKDLHDLLHKLQFRCYNVIVQEVARFPDDSLAVDNLLNYEVTLQDIIAQLRAVAGRGLIPHSEVNWIEEVVQAQQLLNQALTHMQVDGLKRAVWLLKRVIALQPSSINQRLNMAARALRLEALVQAMKAIRDGLNTLNLDRGQIAQFETGVTALESLHTRLATLVEAHDNWQTLERILSRIEDVMVYDLTELELSWPDVEQRVTNLCQEPSEDWVQLLLEDGGQLGSALAAQNPALIQRYFRRYRQRAGNRFYQVDVMLKALCEELRQVGEPLTSVLRLLA
jgi:DNA-binding MltR family transcriptional regulator